ncbi:flavoprotein [Clostridium sp. WILCCON 0269]|uniref:Flavoprotein n=1 Tax=Candidatus Clostridium eludens TaxID=3381663 RepID=A0ABW8SU28_9CLOT
MDIQDLLRPIVTQIVNMLNKRALLFITGGEVNLKEIFESLSSMSIIKYDIVMTEDAKSVIPESYISSLKGKLIESKEELTNAIKADDLVVIPVMTRNTLSKCAVGIQDNLVTTGIAEALMMDKEIIAVTDSFDPENPTNVSLGLNKNKAYNKFILNYKDTLSSLGINFVEGSNLKKAIEEKCILINHRTVHGFEKSESEPVNSENMENLISAIVEKQINSRFGSAKPVNNTVQEQVNNTVEKVKDTPTVSDVSEISSDSNALKTVEHKRMLSGIITMKDIMTNANGCKEINVKQGALITPLAKDYINNNNITVKYC